MSYCIYDVFNKKYLSKVIDKQIIWCDDKKLAKRIKNYQIALNMREYIIRFEGKMKNQLQIKDLED